MRAFRKWHHDLGLPAPAFLIQTFGSPTQHHSSLTYFPEIEECAVSTETINAPQNALTLDAHLPRAFGQFAFCLFPTVSLSVFSSLDNADESHRM
jgi:hypothetical protein